MKYKGLLAAAASGSIGGITASNNRGGQYFRARTKPVQPNTVFQQNVKGWLAELSSRWVNVLTSAQRDAWDSYASQTPIVDSMGEARNAGGLGMYIRSNVPRRQAGLPLVDTGPSVNALGELTNPGVTSVTASTGIAVVTFTNTDDWAGGPAGALLVYASRGQNPSINGFKGPYRYAGRVLGAGTPPASPQNVTLPFTVAAGQKVFLRFVATGQDGRLSPDFRTLRVAV